MGHVGDQASHLLLLFFRAVLLLSQYILYLHDPAHQSRKLAFFHV